ncbi:hypothetical protein SBDP1_590019 [Syntrophobacter sp. SbD1]|nr:hypothetical protein SBDP1_590019 [Syntrophobacter sp. SbD1]
MTSDLSVTEKRNFHNFLLSFFKIGTPATIASPNLDSSPRAKTPIVLFKCNT